MEEKQRLAKEQEQAAKLRSQQPLAPQSVKPVAATTQVTHTPCHAHTYTQTETKHTVGGRKKCIVVMIVTLQGQCCFMNKETCQILGF